MSADPSPIQSTAVTSRSEREASTIDVGRRSIDAINAIQNGIAACEAEIISETDFDETKLHRKANKPTRFSKETCPLTIVVPVFNERASLPRVLNRIDEVMPAGTQTIIVDDASEDGTAEWLQSLIPCPSRKVLFRKRNHGKGSAVRLGIRHSVGAVVAIQDADTEYDPIDLLDVIAPILEGNAEAVYGSRYLIGGSDPSWFHKLGNWTLTVASNCMTGQRLTDMETCHKAFRGNLIRSIDLREPRFGFEPEITGKLSLRGINIREVPTGYSYRSYEEGKKITWADGLVAFVCMWRYRNSSWFSRSVQSATRGALTRVRRAITAGLSQRKHPSGENRHR
ncbi:MAG: glycosyltransferase family 2 protein [Planctomycetota bacterium]